MITFTGFNHGVYEACYRGEVKPTKEVLIDAVTEKVSSSTLYFTINQSQIDHNWDNWRRNGWCDFKLCVMRKDGRSYLHG